MIGTIEKKIGGKSLKIYLTIFFRSSRSQFAVIGDDLLVQLRQILEEEPRQGESRVFTMARNVYKVRILLLLALDIFPSVSNYLFIFKL